MDATTRRIIAEELGKRTSELADDITRHASEQYPELVTPAFRDVMRESVRSNIDMFRVFLSTDGDRNSIRPGPSTRAMARALASRGLPLSSMIMLFHSAHNILEHKLLIVTHELFEDSSAKNILEILEELRVLTTAFVRAHSGRFPAVYSEETARLRAPGDPELLAEVQKVLRDPNPPATIGAHSLTARQTAVHVWATGSDSIGAETLSGGIAAAARHLGSEEPTLTVFPSPLQAWAWIPVPLDAETSGELKNELPEGVGIALSGQFDGAHAFRRSHLQADALHRVAEQRPEQRQIITAAMDGTLSAAAFVDRLPAAADLVATALGEMATSEEYAEVIRETARSFLRHGIAGAAKDEVVHRNTVKYRVDKFRDVVGEENLTAPDVRLALELAHWFGQSVLTSKTS